MASVQDIRNLASSCASREISPSDLANRFTPVLRAAIKSQDPAVKRLALDVHAQVSHYFHGLISEEELLLRLGLFTKPLGQGVASLSFHVVHKAEPEVTSVNIRSAAIKDFKLHPVTS